MIGEKVFVYRNLHKKCFSVKSLKTGRVIAHVHEIALHDVKFKVSKSGRERVLREKRKNVHAGVVGYVTDLYSMVLSINHSTVSVKYNPYKYSNFVRDDESRIDTARFAQIDTFGIRAIE